MQPMLAESFLPGAEPMQSMLRNSASVCIVLKASNEKMSEPLSMPQSQCQLGEISWGILPLQSHTTLSS